MRAAEGFHLSRWKKKKKDEKQNNPLLLPPHLSEGIWLVPMATKNGMGLEVLLQAFTPCYKHVRLLGIASGTQTNSFPYEGLDYGLCLAARENFSCVLYELALNPSHSFPGYHLHRLYQ